MTILITGGHGLIGSALTQHFRAQGHRVIIVSRSAKESDTISWAPKEGIIDLSTIDSLDAVIHLAGESLVQGRWTEEKKKRILESRRLGTRTIVQALAGRADKPQVLISASGVNYYPSNTDRVMTEDSPPGEEFLAQVCQVWEGETEPARAAGIRVVNARMGVVLTREGGALPKMLPLFKLGLGGRLSHGKQHMSWVALEDVIRIFTQALDDERFSGPINVVSPNVVTNAEFTKTLARSLNRWTFLPVPAFALKMSLGEMAEALLLADLAVKPAVLQRLGFAFKAADLEVALQQ